MIRDRAELDRVYTWQRDEQRSREKLDRQV